MENTKTLQHGSAVIVIHRPQIDPKERALREDVAKQAAARLMLTQMKGQKHGKRNS